jgi:hypothetical protein
MLPVSARLVIDWTRNIDIGSEIIEALRGSRKTFLAELADLVLSQVNAESPNAAVHGNKKNPTAVGVYGNIPISLMNSTLNPSALTLEFQARHFAVQQKLQTTR